MSTSIAGGTSSALGGSITSIISTTSLALFFFFLLRENESRDARLSAGVADIAGRFFVFEFSGVMQTWKGGIFVSLRGLVQKLTKQRRLLTEHFFALAVFSAVQAGHAILGLGSTLDAAFFSLGVGDASLQPQVCEA